MTYSTPLDHCLFCGELFDSAMPIGELGNGSTPSGPFTICLYCGYLMAFGPDRRVRELTSEEMTALADDPQLAEIQKTRRQVMIKAKDDHR
jgi:hypothetical protein